MLISGNQAYEAILAAIGHCSNVSRVHPITLMAANLAWQCTCALPSAGLCNEVMDDGWHLCIALICIAAACNAIPLNATPDTTFSAVTI